MRKIRVDLPGFGATPTATMPSPSASDRAALLLRLLDVLEVHTATVVGHSFGGPVAMIAASRFPNRFSRLVLLASVGRFEHQGARRMPPVRMMRALLATPVVGSLVSPLYMLGMRSAGFRGRYTRTELIHMNACMTATSYDEIVLAIENLQVPTLVAWAEDDRLIECDVARDLSAAAPEGPRLSWRTGGHNIQKSRAIELAETLGKWLTALETIARRQPGRSRGSRST